MFYNKKVMNGVTLKHAWRAANNQSTKSHEVSLPEVCLKLDSWIGNDYPDAGRRLSLRTSSIFIDGAAKLYKEGLQHLLEDVYELEMKIIKRKRNHSSRDSEDECDSEEPTRCSNLNSVQHTNTNNNGSFNEVGEDHDDREEPTSGHSDEQSSNDGSLNDSAGDGDDDEEEPEKNTQEEPSFHRKRTRNQAVQTTVSFVQNIANEDESMKEFDESLPFGHIMIYDSISTIPKKIMFCTLNSNVRKFL